MDLFSDDATFITSTGNYFAGKKALAGFYSGLILSTDSIHYAAGTPTVRILDANNALIYYTWKVDWYRSSGPRPTRLNDIGMMSITAQKRDGRWWWVAITSQGLPTFFDRLTDR